MTTDGELVRQALGGRSAAYGELARRWAPKVMACCHAVTGCRQAAEDLAQEALLRGLRHLPSLEEPHKFGSWLRGVARRTCLDWLKSKKRSEVQLGALGSRNGDGPSAAEGLLATEGDAAERDIDRADDVRRLMDEVEALPENYREVVLLYYYQDVTYEDLAETLGVSAATVNARLTKARALLRQRLRRTSLH